MFSVCLYVVLFMIIFFYIFFFKQKTAYEMRISDWSSDVCSSDLPHPNPLPIGERGLLVRGAESDVDLSLAMGRLRGLAAMPDVSAVWKKIGRASCRERVCQYV